MSDLAPAPLLLIILATACATLAHVLWGRRWRQLPFFWMVAFAGCLLVYGIGAHLPLDLPRPAGVPVLEAVLCAWALVSVASRLRV